MTALVFVNQERFFFRDLAVLDRVRAAIEVAVRSGGAFVRIGSDAGPEMLITASTTVRIDTLPDVSDVTGDDHDGIEFVDFDHLTFVDIDDHKAQPAHAGP